MPRTQELKGHLQDGFALQLRPPGIFVFSMALLALGGFLGAFLLVPVMGKPVQSPGREHTLAAADASARTGSTSPDTPPWGELLASDIDFERPDEFAAAELQLMHTPAWVFDTLPPEKVGCLLASCGLNSNQVLHALSLAVASTNATGTVIRPDDELVFSLSPGARAKLYEQLARWDDNHYMRFPFCISMADAAQPLAHLGFDPGTASKLERLLYRRGSATCLSDIEVLLRNLCSDQARLQCVKALSRQRALLVRVRIRPDTDLDKLLSYWGRGVAVRDVRPLLEAVQRLDGGSSVSLLYLLPSFARDRLYTFPDPPRPNEPSLDCHWTTMNFFNEQPDARFADLGYTADYLKTHFYQVPNASAYGDVILFLDKDGFPLHSAVYLADDIIFTKNGNNYTQPWMLMRIKEVLAMYSQDERSMVAVYRSKRL